MTEKSISAYDVAERIERYDHDMDLMHPLRHKMIDIVLKTFRVIANENKQNGKAPKLPEAENEPKIPKLLDIGSGTGFFTEKFIQIFPEADIVAIDGAQTMIDLAKHRLGEKSRQVYFRTGDFNDLAKILCKDEKFDVIISSYALHHLNEFDKLTLLKTCVDRLNPGGWFFNADLIYSETEEINTIVQTLRADGIIERAGGNDPRFKDVDSVKEFINELEAGENDQPLTLTEDLILLHEAGFENSSLLWCEHREAVTCGKRSV